MGIVSVPSLYSRVVFFSAKLSRISGVDDVFEAATRAAMLVRNDGSAGSEKRCVLCRLNFYLPFRSLDSS
jgi:hypothetical protein